MLQEPPVGDQAGEEQQPDNPVKAVLSKQKTIGNFDKDTPPPSVIQSRPSEYTLNKLNSSDYGISQRRVILKPQSMPGHKLKMHMAS